MKSIRFICDTLIDVDDVKDREEAGDIIFDILRKANLSENAIVHGIKIYDENGKLIEEAQHDDEVENKLNDKM